MNHGDIDDLLINMNDNLDEAGKSKDPLKETERSPASPGYKPAEKKEIKEEKKERITKHNTPHEDLSFLDSIDSNKSTDGGEGFEEKPDEISEELPETGDNKKAEENIIEPATGDKQEAEFKAFEFILRGKRSWNTREPYIANINHEKLNADYQDLIKTFYFIKENIQEQVIQSEMKRAMFKFIRAPEKNVFEEYSEFINSRLSSLVADLAKNFSFPQEQLHLFIYHLGVITLYKIIISAFQDSKSGYCFKLLPGNSVVKYIPAEFIKQMILKWHNDNINSNDIPYDAIIEYNEVKRVISGFYMAEYEKCNKKLDDIMEKSNKNISKLDRDQIFKSKWDEWFGKTNIFVYNRFLDRTVFKMIK